MAEKKAGLFDHIKKGALIFTAALATAEAAWFILPAAAFAIAMNTLLTGVYYGSIAGAAVWSVKKMANLFSKPEPQKA